MEDDYITLRRDRLFRFLATIAADEGAASEGGVSACRSLVETIDPLLTAAFCDGVAVCAQPLREALEDLFPYARAGKWQAAIEVATKMFPAPEPRPDITTRDIKDAIEGLVAEGLVVDSGRRRNGQVVWVARDYAADEGLGGFRLEPIPTSLENNQD